MIQISYLDRDLFSWPTHLLDPFANEFELAIRKGVTDAFSGMLHMQDTDLEIAI